MLENIAAIIEAVAIGFVPDPNPNQPADVPVVHHPPEVDIEEPAFNPPADVPAVLVNERVVDAVVSALPEVEVQQPLAHRGLRNRQLPFALRPGGDTPALPLTAPRNRGRPRGGRRFWLVLYFKAFNLILYAFVVPSSHRIK